MATTISVKIDERGARIIIQGALNEETDYTPATHTLSAHARMVHSVSFDLGDVNRTNSVGIKNWLMFLEKLPRVPFIFTRISERIVEQVNMIPNALGSNFKIERFAAPFYCPKCDEPVSLEFTAATFDQSALAGQQCPTCAGEIEFDALEDEYLHFLKRKAPAAK